MFQSYEKMCSSSNELGEIPKPVMRDQWVVLEKIHGANFSFVVDQNSITPARVSQFVDTSILGLTRRMLTRMCCDV